MSIVRRKVTLVLILFLLVVTACQQTPASPPTPTRVNTFTPLPPTFTPTITPTPTVTPTPFAQAGVFDLIQGVDGVLPGTLTGMQINNNTLWLFSNKGAAWRSLTDTTFNKVLFKTTLLGVDANGLLWTHDPDFGTISAWDGTRWKSFNEKEGWLIGTQLAKTPLKTSLLTDSSGDTWLGVSWGAVHYDGLNWTRYPFYQMGFMSPVAGTSRSLVFASTADGSVWAASCLWKDQQPIGEGGLSRFDGTTWQTIGLPEQNVCATAITSDPSGGLWVATSTQLLDLAPGAEKFLVFPYPEIGNRSIVYFAESIQLDPEGNPWMGLSLCTSNGCGQLRARYALLEEQWSQVGEAAGWQLHPVLFDRQGKDWVLTENEISLFHSGELEKISDLTPVGGAVDADGNIWLLAQFGESSGLWSIKK
jgi:hypothetical protein